MENVNTLIGTSGGGYGYGSLPAVANVPFSAFRAGPATATLFTASWRHFSSYNYMDKSIRSFSHTKVAGAGVADLGNIGIMPFCEELPLDWKPVQEEFYWQPFSHQNEISKPGYYSIQFEDCPVLSELTAAGTMSGMHRHSFSESASTVGFIFDACQGADIQGVSCLDATLAYNSITKEMTGSVLSHGSLSDRGPDGGIHVYFSIDLSSLDVNHWSTWVNADEYQNEEGSSFSIHGSTKVGAALYLNSVSPSVEFSIGLSFIDIAHATMNRQVQMQSNDILTFDDAVEYSQELWSSTLDQALTGIVSKSDSLVTQLYTAVYHSFSSPTIYSEYDCQYLGLDAQVHTMEGCNDDPNDLSNHFFSDLSIWDTFRTQHPWITLTRSDVSIAVARSMVLMMEQGGGCPPKWVLGSIETGCMIGSHANAVLLDTYRKGLTGFDVEAAFQSMKAQATGTCSNNARGGLNDWWSIGYISTSSSSSGGSLTLTYAFDDWATSQLAGLLGHDEDEAFFASSALNYKNIWSDEAGVMCPRDSNGTFECPRSPSSIITNFDIYTEGDALQWTLFVPHDIQGLAALMGGEAELAAYLDDFFENHEKYWAIYHDFMPNPYYWAGNEIGSHHVFMYNFLSSHSPSTQAWSRKLVEMHYQNRPDGIPGNDDYGAMSTWLLFAGLGLYPFTGTDYYTLGSPSVDHAKIRAGDAWVEIFAHNNSHENVFVSKVVWNGEELTSPFIFHEQLIQGGKLEFYMSDSPAMK